MSVSRELVSAMSLLRDRQTRLAKLAARAPEEPVVATATIAADDPPPGECCPSCDARLERGDDGKCNRCGADWPEPAPAGVDGQKAATTTGPATGPAPYQGPQIDVSRLSPVDPSGAKRTPEQRAMDWAHARHAAFVRQDMYNKAVQLGTYGLGLGAAWGGLQGTLGLLRREKKKSPKSVLEVKTGQFDTPTTPRKTFQLADADVPAPVPDPGKSPVGYMLGGYGADKWYQSPLGIPLAGAAIYGGARLGHGVTDWLMRRRRDDEQERQIARQKARYEAAMRKISSKLDRLAEILETPEGRQKLAAILEPKQPARDAEAMTKQAAPGQAPGAITLPKLFGSLTGGAASLDPTELSLDPRTVGPVVGALLAGGGLSALWAHQRANEYFKKRQPAQVLRKAQEEQEEEEFRRAPRVPITLTGGSTR